MRKHFHTILTFLLLSGCASKQVVQNPEPLKKINESNMRDILINAKLVGSSGMHTFSMKFKKNGRYELNYGSEGWYWENQGKYNQEGLTIVLNGRGCTWDKADEKGCNNTFQTGTCIIEEATLSLVHEYRVACSLNRKFHMYTSDNSLSDWFAFEIPQFKLPAGVERDFRGHKVVTTNNVVGTVKDTIFLREGPGTEYKTRDYVVNAYDGPYLKNVPRGKKVIVHARTPLKYRVKDWENYWLVISIDDSRNVWAFGEFIDY